MSRRYPSETADALRDGRSRIIRDQRIVNSVFARTIMGQRTRLKTADGSHGDRTRTMDGLRGTTVLLSLVAVAATTTTASAGRPYATEWFQATVDGCRTAGWTKCVAQNVDRTFRLLEDADDLRIAGGVRLVRTAAKTTNPTNRSSDVVDRIVSFMDSHSLQIDLWTPDNNVTVEGRRRHAYRKVFPIIVGTYMIMSAVLIPMGFMFMSTLGGKALLVSKMALMISLMSNIKKMFSYEYYVPPAPPAGPQHWKRTLLAHRTTAGPLYSSYTAY